jgi:hypothetical protein
MDAQSDRGSLASRASTRARKLPQRLCACAPVHGGPTGGAAEFFWCRPASTGAVHCLRGRSIHGGATSAATSHGDPSRHGSVCASAVRLATLGGPEPARVCRLPQHARRARDDRVRAYVLPHVPGTAALFSFSLEVRVALTQPHPRTHRRPTCRGPTKSAPCAGRPVTYVPGVLSGPGARATHYWGVAAHAGGRPSTSGKHCHCQPAAVPLSRRVCVGPPLLW